MDSGKEFLAEVKNEDYSKYFSGQDMAVYDNSNAFTRRHML